MITKQLEELLNRYLNDSKLSMDEFLNDRGNSKVKLTFSSFVKDAYNKGFTIRQIAEITDRSITTVHRKTY